MSRKKAGGEPGNYVSEWFGHRVHPTVISTPESLADQQNGRCPFLSSATVEDRPCIKSAAAKGVCTISSVSNGPRQDWLVCPYRALSAELVTRSTQQLFAVPSGTEIFVTPASTLAKEPIRADIRLRLGRGQPVFIYFDKKTGGELSIPPSERSPEFSFDVTIVELTMENGDPHVGRFGILEIQTMDFHGSYRDAVRNLTDGLRLHPSTFGPTIQGNQHWLADGVEGPNIANVFKRTFYQMIFKFQLGQHERCVGCVLAIPQSVWDSWQRHLGAPTLSEEGDGTVSLLAPGRARLDPCPAWVYVFEPDAAAAVTPSPIRLNQMIGTDAPSISHWALEVAPEAALSNIDAEFGFLANLSRRVKAFWPELARTIQVAAPTGGPAKGRRRKKRVHDISLEQAEAFSSYAGPGPNAVHGEEPDDG